MIDPVEYVLKYLWLIGIIMFSVGFIILRIRCQKYIKKNPELEDGYKNILRVLFTFSIIPWLVLGVCQTIGKINSPVELLTLPNDNPYKIIFWVSYIGVILLGNYWIFFRDGAEIFSNHPGILNSFPAKDKTLPPKVYSIFVLLIGLIFLIIALLRLIQE